MVKFALLALIGFGATMVSAVAVDAANPPAKKAQQQQIIEWSSDYPEAMRQAKQGEKMLLILFDHSKQPRSSSTSQIESQVRGDSRLQAKLDRYVFVRVPTDYKITVKGQSSTLLQHRAFSELQSGAGLAIIDFAHKDASHYGHVVSAIRFNPGKYYTFQPEHVKVLLDLPAGTLTQRSMVFAVRIHPERPASTSGTKDAVLTDEAASHSRYQAQIGVQGHHHWDSRFQRILGRLFGGGRYYGGGASSAPVEVVAESWPNQDLLDSCVDCVHSWRQSSGHWSAVRAPQSSYGYDIRRGRNGIWYATGIFSR